MVGGVVLRPQRNQPEAGPGKLQRHDEVGGHERPFSHDRERNPVPGSDSSTDPFRIQRGAQPGVRIVER